MGITISITKEKDCKCCGNDCSKRIKISNRLHCMCCPLQHKVVAFETKKRKENQLKKKNDFIHAHQLICYMWDECNDLGDLRSSRFYKDLSNNYFFFDKEKETFKKITDDSPYMELTPERKKQRKQELKELKEKFIKDKGLSLINVNNKDYYFNKETNQLYEKICYTHDIGEIIPTRCYKLILGKKFQNIIKEYEKVKVKEN